MANFRAYTGLWVRVTKAIGDLIVGEEIQTLTIPGGLFGGGWLAFVGKRTTLNTKDAGAYIEPIRKQP